LNDPEMMDHLKDIILEGFDYTDPCNYGDYDSYRINIVNDSAITFINSYSALSGEEQFISDKELEVFVAKVIVSKHRSRIEREYRDRDCDEEEEEEDDKTEWWFDK
jgi:hypothetical protein